MSQAVYPLHSSGGLGGGFEGDGEEAGRTIVIKTKVW